MTQWKPIPGFDGYEASSDGHIRNSETLKQPKTYINNAGYYLAYCHPYGTCLVHRLVCLTFNPNPNNLAQVNHINANKLDNRPENLEWVSLGDNVRDFWNNPVHKEKQDRRRKQISDCIKSRIWVTDGTTNYRIHPEEMQCYPSFRRGKTHHRKEVTTC